MTVQPTSTLKHLTRNSAQIFGDGPLYDPQSDDVELDDGDTPIVPEGGAVPQGYTENFSDVKRASVLSILTDPALHYQLYGVQQGRAILAQINGNIERVVMISPSHLKQCGIGEYGRYLSDELGKQVKEIKVVRTTNAAIDLGEEYLRGALVVVNHGPGLYDGLNPRLSQGESTTRMLQNLYTMHHDMGALPVLIHHSLLDTDHDLLFSRQAQILSSEFPSLTFISSAARQFYMTNLELGVSPVPVPEHVYEGNRDERPEVIGFFGFFQYGGKDFDSLFHLVRELRGRLVGSVATGNAEELKKFEDTLEDLDLPHDFGSGWVDDTELLERLKDADYFYLPQNDYDHWNNSATARFVTNLDRPLFLPPHHPFLDMRDGSIFSSKDDLPRIVAYFREPGRYKQGVERVQAFRERASMANTAKAILTELSERQSGVGEGLLETASATSAERYLELPEAKRKDFAAALGADPDQIETFPALWRSADSRQFWRKHYEIGDFVHSNLLCSLASVYLAVTKRQVTFTELMGVIHHFRDLKTDADLDQAFGEVLRVGFIDALKKRGGPFHEPEIVLLQNGAAAPWEEVMDADAITAFRAAKVQRQDTIKDQLRKNGGIGAQPPLTNILEMLVLPTNVVRSRTAAADLTQLDWDYIHAVRRPVQRLNRLIEQANATGLQLSDHFVFDHLVVPEIDHKVHSYVMEDFIYVSGDMYFLHAIRCLCKRDPFPIETMVLQSMMARLGPIAVLEHLVAQSGGRITISNLDPTADIETQELTQFMHAARDPLFGLVEARNEYEVARRHNGRWWLKNKTESDAFFAQAGGEIETINLLYKALCQANLKHETSLTDPLDTLDSAGRFRPRKSKMRRSIRLVPNKQVQTNIAIAPIFGQAASGFHELEETGVWTNGPEGMMSVQLSQSDDTDRGTEQAVIQAEVGFFGSEHFEEGRTFSMALYDSMDTQSKPLASVTHSVETDRSISVQLPIPGDVAAGNCMVAFEIDEAISPLTTGVSEDPRLLGVRLESLTLVT